MPEIPAMQTKFGTRWTEYSWYYPNFTRGIQAKDSRLSSASPQFTMSDVFTMSDALYKPTHKISYT